MEVAASARSLGVEVVLIDVMPAPLAGLLGPDVSRWLVGLHRDEGVEVVLGEGVAAARRGALELVSGVSWPVITWSSASASSGRVVRRGAPP